MRCPNCSSEVSPGPSCPNCGAPLAALPGAATLPARPMSAAPASANFEGLESIPLTVGQKARLLFECLPLPFFVLALVFVLTILDDITGAPPPVFLPLFLGLVIVMVGWAAVQRLRDVASGVAVVREDLLQRAYHSRRGQSGNRFRGKFEQLGTLRLTSNAYRQASEANRRYRVYYSPASKIVWSLEPID
jgi:hypothetical protein